MHFACVCNNVFLMISCLQINCPPFSLHQLLNFRPFEWLIEIYLQTEGQGIHHAWAITGALYFTEIIQVNCLEMFTFGV